MQSNTILKNLLLVFLSFLFINTAYSNDIYTYYAFENNYVKGRNSRTIPINADIIEELQLFKHNLYKINVEYPYIINISLQKKIDTNDNSTVMTKPYNAIDIVFEDYNNIIIIRHSKIKDYENKNIFFKTFEVDLRLRLRVDNGIGLTASRDYQSLPNSSFERMKSVVIDKDLDSEYFVSAMDIYINREFNRFDPIVKYKPLSKEELDTIKSSKDTAEISKINEKHITPLWQSSTKLAQ